MAAGMVNPNGTYKGYDYNGYGSYYDLHRDHNGYGSHINIMITMEE